MSKKAPSSPPFILRAFEEKDVLDKRIEKLKSFIATAKFKDIPFIQQQLLVAQMVSMVTYSSILDARLALLDQENCL